jgi:hypothetical protein
LCCLQISGDGDELVNFVVYLVDMDGEELRPWSDQQEHSPLEPHCSLPVIEAAI